VRATPCEQSEQSQEPGNKAFSPRDLRLRTLFAFPAQKPENKASKVPASEAFPEDFARFARTLLAIACEQSHQPKLSVFQGSPYQTTPFARFARRGGAQLFLRETFLQEITPTDPSVF